MSRYLHYETIKGMSIQISIEGRTKVRILIPNSLSTEELTLWNSGVGEDSGESLECKEIKPVNLKRNKS